MQAKQARDHAAGLIEAIARDKDRAAFAELFNFYAPRLKSYMLRLGADEMLAEELTQEVMITVWRKSEQFDRKQASASTWIFRIARNRRIDAYRRTKMPELQPDDPALAPAEIEQPDQLLTIAQMEERVREAIYELPEEQLILLKAAFFDGLSHREIAEKTKLPLGTVKSRIRLAFQKLKHKLEDEL